MYIPQQIVQVLHEERVQELLKDTNNRTSGKFPRFEEIKSIVHAKRKRGAGFAIIPVWLSHLKLNWKWRFAFPQTDNQLACETLCED